MADCQIVHLSSTTLIVLKNLKDGLTKDLVTGATVTGRALDSTGTPVVGVPDPITFTETTTIAKGMYVGEIPFGATLALGDQVTIEITAVAAGVGTRVWTIEALVKSLP